MNKFMVAMIFQRCSDAVPLSTWSPGPCTESPGCGNTLSSGQGHGFCLWFLRAVTDSLGEETCGLVLTQDSLIPLWALLFISINGGV